MKKGVAVFTILLLVLVPVVFASVEINIKTLPDHRVSLFIRAPEGLGSLDSFHKDTGNGDVSFSSSITKSEVDILVTLKKDTNIVWNHKFESVATNKVINIKLDNKGAEIVDSFEAPEEVVEPEEEVTEGVANAEGAVEENTEEVVAEEVTEKSAGITGEAIGDNKNVFSSRTTYYVIGGVLAFLVIAFILNTKRKKMGSGSFKVIKANKDYDDELDDAEEKLTIAKKELDEVREGKKKLKEAKEKFKRDREELAKLEKDY